MSDFTPKQIPDGRKVIDGKTYVGDGKGGWQPIETVKPQHLLEDETVRKILGYAMALNEQMERFKEHTFNDIGNFDAILAQEYDAKLGGAKGNATLMSIDGLFKVQRTVADFIDFGSELQVAKEKIDECLNEWSADARPELRAIVTDAFQTDKAGQINRNRIFMLMRQDIRDERWQEAMRAIRDAIRVVSTKIYVRCYHRPSHDAAWENVSLDIAKL